MRPSPSTDSTAADRAAGHRRVSKRLDRNSSPALGGDPQIHSLPRCSGRPFSRLCAERLGWILLLRLGLPRSRVGSSCRADGRPATTGPRTLPPLLVPATAGCPPGLRASASRRATNAPSLPSSASLSRAVGSGLVIAHAVRRARPDRAVRRRERSGHCRRWSRAVTRSRTAVHACPAGRRSSWTSRRSGHTSAACSGASSAPRTICWLAAARPGWAAGRARRVSAPTPRSPRQPLVDRHTPVRLPWAAGRTCSVQYGHDAPAPRGLRELRRLRRDRSEGAGVVATGPLTIDLGAPVVTVAGARSPVTPREYGILARLADPLGSAAVTTSSWCRSGTASPPSCGPGPRRTARWAPLRWRSWPSERGSVTLRYLLETVPRRGYRLRAGAGLTREEG
mgnify:CR=1 FL=1